MSDSTPTPDYLLEHIAEVGSSAALGHPELAAQREELLAKGYVQIVRQDPLILRVTIAGMRAARALKTTKGGSHG